MSDSGLHPLERQLDFHLPEIWIHDRGDLRRHVDPAALTSKAEPGLRLADAKVAAARFDLQLDRRNSRQQDRAFLDQCAMAALGFKLPYDWTGDVHIRRPAPVASTIAEAGMHKLCLVTMPPERSLNNRMAALAVVALCATRQEAEVLADRLALIHAYSQVSAEAKALLLERRAMRLARLRAPDVAP